MFLKKGDVATIVEHHPVNDSVDGYTLEVFNVFGDTITIITVSESDQIKIWKRLSKEWQDDQTTDEIIDDIYNSRKTGREYEL